MSDCIKDLYDYDLVKKCCRCEKISLKSNFHKKLSSRHGLDPQCIPCVKKCYLEIRDRLLDKQKLFGKQSRYKINARTKVYLNNRERKDVNFRLICKTRSRISSSITTKN